MNLYIFKDLNLTEGIYSNGKNASVKLVSEIPDSSQTLFVLPNELLQYVYFEHELKNKKNVHAKIINDLSALKFSSTNLEVLETKKESSDFFVIGEAAKKLLKKTFSVFNQKVFITSDLLFFNETYDENIKFENNFYLTQNTDPVKLSEKSFNLLDIDETNIHKITNKDLANINLENSNFYELSTFDLQSLFQFSNIKKPLIITVFLLTILYGTGLLNIYSNYSQINNMNATLTSIYKTIYPNEKVSDITVDIQNKLTTLNIEDKSDLKRSLEIISMISQTTKIIEANYINQTLTIKCLFKNDAEESIFINQQNRLNYLISVKDSESSPLGKITTINYEL